LDITPYIKRNYAPLPDRLWALISHINAIPDVLRVAEEHLRRELALPLLEQCLTTFAGIARFHTAELEGIVRQARDSAILNAFHRANRHAIRAYHDFIARLRMRLPQATPTLIMGGDSVVAQLAATDLIDKSIDDLLAIGIADLQRNQADLADVAGRLGMEPAIALRSLGAQHPPAHALLGELRLLLADLHRFLQSQDLITIPPAGNCLVQETLPYMRFGSAFIDAPGPFEAQANEAYLYLTLPDPQWPVDQREAWLAKQSIPGLANTAMHEAWPGHYLQYLHLAQAPTMASKVFTCLTFTEGWAHYAEQIPIEAGYHGDDPYYALQQLSMALLRDCRCIVALRLHSGEF
ncbi:MAG TPA: DUF885 family protein, partial [Ktedonobacterales bacterium]|nr:DUF885 family protein [Ktedonobacterales bacterium]